MKYKQLLKWLFRYTIISNLFIKVRLLMSLILILFILCMNSHFSPYTFLIQSIIINLLLNEIAIYFVCDLTLF